MLRVCNVGVLVVGVNVVRGRNGVVSRPDRALWGLHMSDNAQRVIRQTAAAAVATSP